MGSHGGTYRRTSRPGRQHGSATAASAKTGTWDKVLAPLLTLADAAELINWEVSAHSTVNLAHQHATTFPAPQVGLSNHTNLLTEPPDQSNGAPAVG